MQKKNIAIFTTFTGADPAYSLNRVTQDQIKMFIDNDYKVRVIVGKGFEPVEMYAAEGVELVEISNVPVSNEVQCDNTFSQDVRTLESELSTALKDIDVCITHDIIYQPAALKHQVAGKRVSKVFPKLRWLHWVHSATPPARLMNLTGQFTDEYVNEIQREWPNSFICYPNSWYLPAMATAFNVGQEKVKHIPHPTDFLRFKKYEENTIKLIKAKDMLNADAIAVYPIRLDRGKQVQSVIKTMSMLKELGRSVRVIIVDFHSTGGDKVTYREELKQTGIAWGLNDQELTFTSEFIPEWNVHVPWEVVSDLMDLSNCFIFPSASESYSLITQESGLSRQAQVLNFNLTPLMSIFGPYPYYKKLGDAAVDPFNNESGGDMNTKFDNERMYFKQIAGLLNYELSYNRVLAQEIYLRKYRSLDAVFKNYLEPLLYFEEVNKDAIVK